MGASSVKPTWIRSVQLVACSAALALVDQRGADLIGAKPAILKESRLLCTFGRESGQPGPELAPAHIRRELIPCDLGRAERLLDGLVGNSMLTQLRPNSDRPLAPSGMMVNEARDEPLVGHEPLGVERCHDALDRICVMTLGGELALELFDTVLSPGKQADRRNLDRFVVGCHDDRNFRRFPKGSAAPDPEASTRPASD